MNTIVERTDWEGVAAITLRNEAVSLTVLPSAGARIASLRSVACDREWLWRTADRRPPAGAAPGMAFENGPLLGIDECLPTVAPCVVDGVAMPDHGEAWTSAWRCDEAALARGELTTRLELTTLPLTLERRITLEGGVAIFRYALRNRSARRVRHLWALHPLLNVGPGDRVELPEGAEVRITAQRGTAARAGQAERWPLADLGLRLDRCDLGSSDPAYLKAFVCAPGIGIANTATGARLEFDVGGEAWWGLWVTQRGAWFGHSHVAIEPTNFPADSLEDLPDDAPATLVPPNGERTWFVRCSLA